MSTEANLAQVKAVPPWLPDFLSLRQLRRLMRRQTPRTALFFPNVQHHEVIVERRSVGRARHPHDRMGHGRIAVYDDARALVIDGVVLLRTGADAVQVLLLRFNAAG